MAPEESTIPAPGPGRPPRQFLAELAAAFRRLRPQGSPAWNFTDAFTRLDQEFGPAAGPATGEDPTADGASPEPPGPPVPPVPARGRWPGERQVRERLEAWIAVRADQAARRGVAEALEQGLGRFEDGFAATVDAFRFLSARVEELETERRFRRHPVDGEQWLAPTPSLAGWAGPLAAWLGERPPAGPVVHAQCGDGALCAALARAGVPVRGVDPRGALAWEAAAAGVEVAVAPAGEVLAGATPGTLAGLVLSGVVDRLGPGDRLALLASATQALAPGAPLVVLGTRPQAASELWGPVATDLLPGGPWHPETWELLLERSGCTGVGRLTGAGEDEAVTYAVAARRPA